ncbi:MAG: hypothetical protein NTZ26_09270 [Candidatus Aminicenantes bacterium]|nr:hypothetical protein [Candidatus Aminicenantes bacterium]
MNLSLQEIFRIDTEDDAVAASGLTDIYRFDADADGRIYILAPPDRQGNLVRRFSAEGKFIGSFGRVGQGPGESEYPNDLRAASGGRIWILESPKNKVHAFTPEGKFAEDISPFGFETILPLASGGCLATRLDAGNPQAKYFALSLGLYDSNFKLVKELDRFEKAPNSRVLEKIPEKYINGIKWIFLGQASSDRIYVGNSERGYEILVFDFGGRLIRKIRKEFAPVPVSDEYRLKFLKPYEEGMPAYAKKVYFPDSWHPFQAFFPDDHGRLWVMTYELGASPNEFIFDVFDQTGVFVARRSLNVRAEGVGMVQALIRGDRLYLVQEKPGGFKQLQVLRMIWN